MRSADALEREVSGPIFGNHHDPMRIVMAESVQLDSSVHLIRNSEPESLIGPHATVPDLPRPRPSQLILASNKNLIPFDFVRPVRGDTESPSVFQQSQVVEHFCFEVVPVGEEWMLEMSSPNKFSCPAVTTALSGESFVDRC